MDTNPPTPLSALNLKPYGVVPIHVQFVTLVV